MLYRLSYPGSKSNHPTVVPVVVVPPLNWASVPLSPPPHRSRLPLQESRHATPQTLAFTCIQPLSSLLHWSVAVAPTMAPGACKRARDV
uniref:Uncharacterized protein n=1 Tax=Mesocestoides corti TaxID=53468 RepID=A0A5K3G2A4_MESCO